MPRRKGAVQGSVQVVDTFRCAARRVSLPEKQSPQWFVRAPKLRRSVPNCPLPAPASEKESVLAATRLPLPQVQKA